MTLMQQALTIGIVIFGTVCTRFITFILFPQGKETPKYIRYLGRVLPSAVLGMLVVYCYKNVSFTSGTHGLPELLSGAAVVLIQKWKKNMFLSIVAGTATYMVLIRTIFQI